MRFKFGTDIEDVTYLHVDHIKWAWPRPRDPISKFWDPAITSE